MKNNRCDFCGKAESEVKRLIAGDRGTICNECVQMAHEMIVGAGDTGTLKSEAKDNDWASKKLTTPKEIRAHLDEYVIGQDTAKKVLSVAVYNHYKRLKVGDNLADQDKKERAHRPPSDA